MDYGPDTEGAPDMTEINRIEPLLIFFLIGLGSCRFCAAFKGTFPIHPIDRWFKIFLKPSSLSTHFPRVGGYLAFLHCYPDHPAAFKEGDHVCDSLRCH